MNRLILTLLILVLLPLTLAAAWDPAAELSAGMTLTQSSTEKLRSSIFLETDLLIADFTFSPFSAGLYTKVLANAESATVNRIHYRSYLQASAGLRGDWRITRLYAIFIEAGAGYGILASCDGGYFLLEGAFGQSFYANEAFDFLLKYSLTGRAGVLDHRIHVGLSFWPRRMTQ